MKRILLLLCTLLGFGQLFANGDHYEDTGKLYTVIACVVVIVIGIVLFLFYLERRISKIEKEEN